MNTNLVGQIVAELDQASPATLSAARDKLGDLIAAVRGSVEEMLARSQPNYTAISERAAAIEALVAALSELDKAEATARAALDRIWKKLYSERNQQRVWAKLRNGTPGSAPEPNTA
jgi:chromosome segregation ATPase